MAPSAVTLSSPSSCEAQLPSNSSSSSSHKVQLPSIPSHPSSCGPVQVPSHPSSSRLSPYACRSDAAHEINPAGSSDGGDAAAARRQRRRHSATAADSIGDVSRLELNATAAAAAADAAAAATAHSDAGAAADNGAHDAQLQCADGHGQVDASACMLMRTRTRTRMQGDACANSGIHAGLPIMDGQENALVRENSCVRAGTGDKPDVSSGNGRRMFCTECHKAATVCICPEIPVRVKNRTGITILQHPKEKYHPLGSARIALLGLEDVRVVVVPLGVGKDRITPKQPGSKRSQVGRVGRKRVGRHQQQQQQQQQWQGQQQQQQEEEQEEEEKQEEEQEEEQEEDKEEEQKRHEDFEVVGQQQPQQQHHKQQRHLRLNGEVARQKEQQKHVRNPQTTETMMEGSEGSGSLPSSLSGRRGRGNAQEEEDWLLSLTIGLEELAEERKEGNAKTSQEGDVFVGGGSAAAEGLLRGDAEGGGMGEEEGEGGHMGKGEAAGDGGGSLQLQRRKRWMVVPDAVKTVADRSPLDREGGRTRDDTTLCHSNGSCVTSKDTEGVGAGMVTTSGERCSCSERDGEGAEGVHEAEGDGFGPRGQKGFKACQVHSSAPLDQASFPPPSLDDIPPWIDLPPGTALLYPSPKAAVLPSRPPSSSRGGLSQLDDLPSHLIVLDGTWPKAKRVYKQNPWLESLPHYRLPATNIQPSHYGEIRKEPKRDCLSTIEAVVAALQMLEPDTPNLDSLLSAFRAMVDVQIRCMENKQRPQP